ncbi:MAG: NDP-sugar synthase [DPANN group archaeon]|nr:NDP-sugar synthase [DPANN group archaeon]
MKRKVSMTIEQKLLGEAAGLVDGIRVRNISQAVEYLMSKALGEEKTAVILAGGPEYRWQIGSEYRCSAKLGSMTVVEEMVRKLRMHGFTKIFIVAREKVLTNLFKILGNGGVFGVDVSYTKEVNDRGSADGLRLLKGKINRNFLVIFGDMYFDIDLNALWRSHLKNVASATLTLIGYEKPAQRGVVRLEGEKIVEFVQKPPKAKGNICFEPIFVVGPEIFEYSGASLEEDVFPFMAQKGVIFGHMTSGTIININTARDLKIAREIAQRK